MKRLTCLAVMAASIWAGTGHAADAGLCTSMCGSERRECRANVHELAADDGKPLFEMTERNPMARAAQEQVPAPADRAIDSAGTQARRIDKSAQCDAAYLRCTRACATPAEAIPVKPQRDR